MGLKNRWGIALAALLLLGGVSYFLRPKPAHVPVVAIINFVSYPILDDSILGIKDGLREEGFGEGAVRLIEVNANGEADKLGAYAREVMSAGADIIVPVSTPVAQAVIREAGDRQQIVFSTVTNPNDVGMDKKPRNVTGVSDAVNYGANLDLIRAAFPSATRVGVIYNPGERNSQFGIEALQRLAPEKGLTLQLAAVTRSEEVAAAAASLVGTIDVFYVGSDNLVVSSLAGLLKTAGEAGKPVIASDSGSVGQGALAAVSVDYKQVGRAVAHLVAEMLRSGRPAGDFPNVILQGERLLVNKAAAEKLHVDPAQLGRPVTLVP